MAKPLIQPPMTLRFFGLLTLIAATSASAAPMGAPEALLPDDVILAVHVRDVTGLGKAMEGTLLGRTWDATEGAAWRDEVNKFLDEGSYFDELGISNREMMKLLPGSWVMAVKLPEVPPEQPEHPAVKPPGLFENAETILMMQPESAERWLAVIKEADARIIREKPDRRVDEIVHDGITIYTDSKVDADGTAQVGSAYAVTPEWFVFCRDPLTVKDILDAMGGRALGRRLTEAPGWVDASDRLEGAHASVFVNGARIGKLLDEALRTQAQRSPMVRQFGLDPVRLARVLRLDVLGGAHIGLLRKGDELVIRAGFTWQETAGLVSWLRPEPLARLPVIAPPGILAASVTGYDLAHFWKSLESALQEVNPQLHMTIDQRLEHFRADLGLDVRGALLDNLGNSYSSYAEPRVAEAADLLHAPLSQVVHVALRDPEAFGNFWRRLLEVVPMLGSFWIERDFSGIPVWDLNLPPGLPGPQTSLAIAVGHGGLLLETQGKGLLERVLAQAPGDRTIWDDPDLRSHLAAMPPATSGVTVLDLERLGPLFERIMTSAVEVGKAQASAEDLRVAREATDLFRSLALPAWALSVSEDGPRSLKVETRILEKRP